MDNEKPELPNVARNGPIGSCWGSLVLGHRYP